MSLFLRILLLATIAFVAFYIGVFIAKKATAEDRPYIEFTASTGPVDHYRACIFPEAVPGVVYCYVSEGATPKIWLPPLPPEPFWILAQAVGENGELSERSIPHQNTQDHNGDGSVEPHDLIILYQRWQNPYGPHDFTEMVAHWRDETEATAEGLRWYKPRAVEETR